MSEKEKMLTGQMYNASDSVLFQERQDARKLMRQLNSGGHMDAETRQKLLSDLLPNAAGDINIEPPFFCDYGYNIYCAENVYFNFNCLLLDVMPIRIGANVLFGPNVQVYTATHPVDAMKRRGGAEFARPVQIGNDCWIGGTAIILPGVTIGDRSIVGAGAVVTKDVSADTTVVGNPAGVRP